jgi:hypothetical protein
VILFKFACDHFGAVVLNEKIAQQKPANYSLERGKPATNARLSIIIVIGIVYLKYDVMFIINQQRRYRVALHFT